MIWKSKPDHSITIINFLDRAYNRSQIDKGKMVVSSQNKIKNIWARQVIACLGGKNSGFPVGGPEFEPPGRRDVSPGFTRCCGVSWEAVGSIPAIGISKVGWWRSLLVGFARLCYVENATLAKFETEKKNIVEMISKYEI
ncbi:hypothetical protein LXL04_032632 [Taraxacum kok-saghyz]